MKLYELTDQYNNALNEMVEADLDQETIADTMEGLEGELKIKAKNVAAYYLNLESDLSQLKEAKARIDARIKSIAKNTAFFKDYLRSNMERSGIDKIECPEFKITLRKASKICEVIDPKAVPSEFRTTETITKVDKVGLKKWMIAEGLDEVEGAEIKDGARGLTIK